jgi:hypothetical protein
MTIGTQNQINQSHCYGIECYPQTNTESQRVAELLEQMAVNWHRRSLGYVVKENQIHVVNPPEQMRHLVKAELACTVHLLTDLKIQSRLINQEAKQ